MSSGYYLGKRGEPLIAFEFFFQDESKGVARALRERGLNVLASNLKTKADLLAQKVILGMTKEAHKTLQEFTPVDSGELEEIHTDASKEYDYGVVFIDTQDHYGSKRKKPEEAARLAELLNEGDNSRLNGSAPHKDYIIDAQLDFQARKGIILDEAIGTL